jgi:streptogramin lyase
MNILRGKRSHSKWRLVFATVSVLGVSLAPIFSKIADATGSPTFTSFPVSTEPWDITDGADGNMWVAEYNTGATLCYATNYIAKVTPSGSATSYPLPGNNCGANDLTQGPDGNVWFGVVNNESGGTFVGYIGKITPSGQITEYQLPSSSYSITAMVIGSDGNLWFTESSTTSSYYIGKITPGGTVTAYPIPSGDGFQGGLAAGSDGNIWFGGFSNSGGYISKITPSGTITTYLTQISGINSPESIISGPDGNIWFGGQSTNSPTGGDAIGKITPGGTISSYQLPSDYNFGSLTAGLDGNLWFAGNYVTSIGKITPNGTISFFALPAGYSNPGPLTVGPDGSLWFGDADDNPSPADSSPALGMVTPDGSVSEYSPPSTLYFGSPIVGADGNLWSVDPSQDSVVRIGISGIGTTTPPPPTLSTDTGFRPSRDGFGFYNYGLGSLYDSQYYQPLSLASFEQYFGKQNVLANNGQLRDAVKLLYNEYSNPNVIPLTTDNDYEHSSEAGRCFGFSGASMLNFLNLSQSSAGTFALPHGQYTGSSVTPATNPRGESLGDILGYYFGVQSGNEANTALSQSAIESQKNPTAILDQIEQSILSGDPIQVGIVKAENTTSQGVTYPGQTGHSLVAYRYQDVGNAVHVYVYDSNHPNNDGEYITFNPSNNSWNYDPDSLGPWGSNVKSGALELLSAEDYTHQGVLPWDSNSLLSLQAQPSAELTVTAANGQVLGYQNGQIVGQLDDAAILPTLDASPNSTGLKYELPLNSPYTVNYSNVVGQDEPVSLYANGTYIEVSGLTPTKGSSASLTLGSDDKSVTVNSTAHVSSYTITLDQESSTSSLTYTVTNASLNPGEKTTFGLLGNSSQLQIKNSGTNKTYTVAMQETGGNDSTLTEGNIALGGNATDTWEPSDWDNLSTTPVSLTVDPNSNGTSVSTVVANAASIDNGDQYTQTSKVTLRFVPPFMATKMRVSDYSFDGSNKYWPQWQKFSASKAWQLPGWDGNHSVHVQFESASGTVSKVYSTSIVLDNSKPQIYWVSINDGKLVTSSTNVNVHIDVGDWVSPITSMKVSNTSDLSNVAWQPYQKSFNWTVSGSTINKRQWAYVQVEDAAGNVSRVFKASVWLLP